MKILHLSDLHIDTIHLRDQRVVLKALFSDLQAEIEANGEFDFIFFTGDLIAKGDYSPENIKAAKEEFIEPLLETTKLEPARLFMIPGNHDINLRRQSKNLASARKALSVDTVADYLDEAVQPGSPNTGLEQFNELMAGLSHTPAVLQNTHYSSYKVNVGITVGIAAINSAWCATGAASDGDYGQLLVGTKQIDELTQSLQDVDVRIALMHHPANWMMVKDSRYIHRQLLLHFDGLFHGHNHEPDAQCISGSSNNYFVSNAGCLYQSRDYFNGYCIVSFSAAEHRWDVRAREYIEARQVFDKALRFAPDGRATFIRTAKEGVQTAPIIPSEEYIEALQAAFNSHLLSALVSDVAPPTLRSIFVDPPISKVSPRQLSAEQSNGSSSVFLPLKDVLATKRNTLFVGAKDIGKTTLLHHICSLSLDLGQNDLPPFAAYVDLDTAGETRAAILESITTFGRGAYRRSEFLALLATGSLLICFDSVRSTRAKQSNAVTEFCREFSKCRFFFTANEEIEYSLSAELLPKLTTELDVLFLHPFGRKETRQLTQKWYGESLNEASPKVDEVLSLLSRLNIPRSPFLISALLWIRERQIRFTPVNQAEILDTLIDGVMEKLSESKERSGLDSNIKRHFLAALSEYLHKIGSRRITSHALDAFTVNYFEAKGLISSAGPFLAELKKKSILLEVGNDVTFMFDSIRAFFLSSRIHESRTLLNEALSFDQFLTLGEELDYFTGRHRDKDEVLRRAVEVVEQFRLSAGLNSDLNVFETITIKGGPLSISSDDKLNLALSDHQPSAESREVLLESIDEQTRFRGPLEVEEIRLSRLRGSIGKYLEALRIGSAILRNSELIDDIGLKKSAYAQFSRCWCEIMIAVLLSVESSDEDNQGLEVLRGFLPTDNANLASYLLKVLVPNVIMSLAAESLGTAKLQLIIEEKIEKSESTVETLINTFLSVDLDFPKRFLALQDLLTNTKKNRFVAELVFFKLIQLFFFSRLSNRDVEKVRDLLGNSMVQMMSIESGEDRSRVKSRLLAGLEKARLLRK